MTCAEVQDRVHPHELVDWLAWDRFPSESWLQCATICQTIVLAFTGKQVDQAEFMPDRFRLPVERKPMTAAQLRAALRSSVKGG